MVKKYNQGTTAVSNNRDNGNNNQRNSCPDNENDCDVHVKMEWVGEDLYIKYKSTENIAGIQIDLIGNAEITSVNGGDAWDYLCSDPTGCLTNYFPNGGAWGTLDTDKAINRLLYLDIGGSSIPETGAGGIWNAPWETLFKLSFDFHSDYDGLCFHPDQETWGFAVLTGEEDFQFLHTKWGHCIDSEGTACSCSNPITTEDTCIDCPADLPYCFNSICRNPCEAGVVEMGDFPGAGGFRCGGALIARDWVLTAAHCCHGVTNPYQDGGIGSSTGIFNQAVIGMHESGWIFGDPENEAPEGGFTPGMDSMLVDGTIIHPDYHTGTEINDFCLVHLANPAPMRFEPVKINKHRNLISGGNQITSIGAGITVPGLGQGLLNAIIDGTVCPGNYWHGTDPYDVVAPTLQDIQIPIIDDCGDWAELGLIAYDHQSRFCAGGCYEDCIFSGDIGEQMYDECPNICDGDSGGPSIMYVKKSHNDQLCTSIQPDRDPNCEPVLVGLTGMMPYYCTCVPDNDGNVPNLPAIFSDVSYVSDWIQNCLNGNCVFDVPSQCFDCMYWMDQLIIDLQKGGWSDLWTSEHWSRNLEPWCEIGWNSPYHDQNHFCNWVPNENYLWTCPPGLTEWECSSDWALNIGGSCQCMAPDGCCESINLESLSNSGDWGYPLEWLNEVALGSGWTYRTDTPENQFQNPLDTRLISGQEVSPACGMGLGPDGVGEDRMSTCKYPFYVALGTGFPIPDGDDLCGGCPPGLVCEFSAPQQEYMCVIPGYDDSWNGEINCDDQGDPVNTGVTCPGVDVYAVCADLCGTCSDGSYAICGGGCSGESNTVICNCGICPGDGPPDPPTEEEIFAQSCSDPWDYPCMPGDDQSLWWCSQSHCTCQNAEEFSNNPDVLCQMCHPLPSGQGYTIACDNGWCSHGEGNCYTYGNNQPPNGYVDDDCLCYESKYPIILYGWRDPYPGMCVEVIIWKQGQNIDETWENSEFNPLGMHCNWTQPSECQNHQFECNDGSCIPDVYACDEKCDCPDCEDESGCDDYVAADGDLPGSCQTKNESCNMGGTGPGSYPCCYGLECVSHQCQCEYPLWGYCDPSE